MRLADTPGFAPERLSGRKIAVRQGSSHAEFLRRYLPTAQPVGFVTEIEALDALRAGQVDAYFGDAMRASFWLNQHTDAGERIVLPQLRAWGEAPDVVVITHRTPVLAVLDLLLLPAKARLANKDYERARYDVAGAVLGVVAEVESGWYEYVAARQVAAMREAVAEGAAASAELAQRFHDAGNISDLQLAQEQAVASEARIEALRARAEAGRKALALHSLLGLRGEEANWEASDSLPLPVPTEDDPEQLANLARDGNLAVLAARAEADVLADALGLTRTLRWFGGSEIGYEREREADGARLQGPEISLELPIFNQGQAKLARAEAQKFRAAGAAA